METKNRKKRPIFRAGRTWSKKKFSFFKLLQFMFIIYYERKSFKSKKKWYSHLKKKGASWYGILQSGDIDRKIYGSVPQINPYWSLRWDAVHHNWCIFTEWQWGFLVKSWFGGFQPERAIATLSTPPRSWRLLWAWGSKFEEALRIMGYL